MIRKVLVVKFIENISDIISHWKVIQAYIFNIYPYEQLISAITELILILDPAKNL